LALTGAVGFDRAGVQLDQSARERQADAEAALRPVECPVRLRK